MWNFTMYHEKSPKNLINVITKLLISLYLPTQRKKLKLYVMGQWVSWKLLSIMNFIHIRSFNIHYLHIHIHIKYGKREFYLRTNTMEQKQIEACLLVQIALAFVSIDFEFDWNLLRTWNNFENAHLLIHSIVINFILLFTQWHKWLYKTTIKSNY